VSGYWTAAFDDEVVLVITGGTELSPGEYGFALLAHLAGPVIGGAALLVATVRAARSVRPATRTGDAPVPAAA
jgi:hypothetical protein